MRDPAFRSLALAVLFCALAGAQEAVLPAAPYLDPRLEIAERVDDLLGRMTLEEKIGQMTQVDLQRLMGEGEWDRGPLNEEWLRRILVEARVGSLLSGGGAAPVPNDPATWAETTNALQRYALANSRLRIPIVYGIDAVHGHNNVVGAVIYPHNIGLAATFDPALVEEVAAATARDVRATGIHWNFAPVADVGRDLRWGRFYETFGEDPHLASELVSAAVRGYQGDDIAGGESVAATVKHFVGYSTPASGRDRSPAFLDLRTLKSVHLPPFSAGIEAGAAAVMANSGSVNGVPVHASRYLLTEVLRQQLGFDGVLVSDWEDIQKLVTQHRVARDFGEAVAMSINAGVDVYMVPHDAEGFTGTLRRLVEQGLVEEERIDEAAGRVLALKFRLGLFERPLVDPRLAAETISSVGSGLAVRAAVESLTLLENDGVLPFAPEVRRLLVAGPNADSVAAQMGGWTIGWQGVGDPLEAPPAVTAAEGLEAGAPDGVAVEVLGAGAGEAQLQQAAAGADAIVLVLGEASYAEGQGDDQLAELPSDQAALARRAIASGKPVVAVIVAGRPLMVPEDVRDGLGALLMAYLPGSGGGAALAEVLYGRADPGGRLPFSWPRHTGQLPLTYDVLTQPGAYEPLYAFGTGLSYAAFEYRELTARVEGDAVALSVEVANVGARAGSEVVQAYLERPPLGVLVPARQLVAFGRLELEPGASRRVELSVPLARLAVIPGDVLGDSPPEVGPGVYTFTVGDLEASVELP